jgi:hypothetical protein
MYKKCFAITVILVLAGGLFAVGNREGNLIPTALPSERVGGSGPVEVGTGAIMTVDAYWRTDGNAETTPGTHFLGTTDNEAFEIKVNDQRVLRIEPTAVSPHIIAGHQANSNSSLYGATICGGGREGYPNTILSGAHYSSICGGVDNTAGGSFSTIGGGTGNETGGTCATIGGGHDNFAGAGYNSIGGGYGNETSGSSYIVIGGGLLNEATGYGSTIGGGYYNEATGSRSTVGGGYYNYADGSYATVPGGYCNEAEGDYSFAAGRRAKTYHLGCFVWGDSQNANISSTSTDEFIVRAQGGIWFGANSSPSTPSTKLINTSTGAYLSSGGTWTNASDRDLKQGFQSVDEQEILQKVAELPITVWNYKDEDASTKHIGPVAQDFHDAFGLGQDDKSISTVDANGVALAAIQALYKENQELKAQVEDLTKRLEALEKEK